MNPPGIQVVIAGALGALIVSAIALTAVPAAAVARIATMTLSLCFAYWFVIPSIHTKLHMTIVGFDSIAILGIARITRWPHVALQELARIRTTAEQVLLLPRA